jgi:hypothetical protein
VPSIIGPTGFERHSKVGRVRRQHNCGLRINVYSAPQTHVEDVDFDLTTGVDANMQVEHDIRPEDVDVGSASVEDVGSASVDSGIVDLTTVVDANMQVEHDVRSEDFDVGSAGVVSAMGMVVHSIAPVRLDHGVEQPSLSAAQARAMQQPQFEMSINTDPVGTQTIALHHQPVAVSIGRGASVGRRAGMGRATERTECRQGKRGPDRRKRKPRTCRICKKSNCPARWGKSSKAGCQSVMVQV